MPPWNLSFFLKLCSQGAFFRHAFTKRILRIGFYSNVKWKQNLRNDPTNFLPNKKYKFLTTYNTSVPKDGMTGWWRSWAQTQQWQCRKQRRLHYLSRSSWCDNLPRECVIVLPTTYPHLKFFLCFVVCFKMHYAPRSVLSKQHVHVHQLLMHNSYQSCFIYYRKKNYVVFIKSFTSILRSVF